MKSPLTFFLFISLVTFLDQSICAEPQPKVQLQARKEWKFENEGIVFSNDFSGARLNDCSQIEKNIFKVTIEPENHPINRSPWYAFKISSAKKQSIQVRFNLTHPGIASKPKISLDGRQWQPLEKKLWTPADSERKLPPQPYWRLARHPSGCLPINLWVSRIWMTGSLKFPKPPSQKSQPLENPWRGDPSGNFP